MKATEVFTPQRMPTVTLVTDHLAGLNNLFDEAVDEGGKLIRVIGPSKSGKTVFVNEKVGKGNVVAITGAGINSPDDLWVRALDAIGSNVEASKTASSGSEGSYSGTGKVSGNICIAKGEVQGTVGRAVTENESQTFKQAVDILQQVIREFSSAELSIFVDDFHYIPSQIQTEVAKQFKQAVEKGVRLICAAVPYRSEDVIRANDDLQGRVVDLVFKYWGPINLIEIARQGFDHLKIQWNETYAEALAEEAAGSPQLMQTLCLQTCFELGVRDVSERAVAIPAGKDFFEAVCRRAANSVDFSSTIEKLIEGPLTRGRQRISYTLIDGTNADVYPILVRALAVSPPSLHLRYPELTERVKHLCVKETPSGSSISDACFHLAKIANSGFSVEKIDWNGDEQVLSIRDPYLLFSMRWSEA